MGQHDVLRISLGLLGYSLILFENQIQTTSASPCCTQVQPAASFLVCSLIFIEYQIPPATQQVSLNLGQTFQYLTQGIEDPKKQPSVD